MLMVVNQRERVEQEESCGQALSRHFVAASALTASLQPVTFCEHYLIAIGAAHTRARSRASGR
jgi:hypothetical protein